MKRQIGGAYMPSIEEDCRFLRQCLAEEANKPLGDSFDNEKTKGTELESAWKDYEQCRYLDHGLMRYAFETPMELKRRLEELWEGDFSEEFILSFLAMAYRWGNTSIDDNEDEDG